METGRWRSAFIGKDNITKPWWRVGASVSTRENIFLEVAPVLPSGVSAKKNSDVWILTLNNKEVKLRHSVARTVSVKS